MRVLIVSASMGAGHGGAAAELADQLSRSGHQSRQVDFLAALPAGWGRFMRSIYRFQLRHVPWTYDVMYRLRYRFPDVWGGVNSFYIRLTARRLLGWADEWRPDVIISLYPLASAVLGGLRQRGRVGVPVVTYITDFGVHPLWVHPGVDLHLGVHPACAAEAARRSGGIAAVCVPLVARPAPALAGDRRSARQRLGLANSDRVALIVAGSWGVGGIERTVRAVAACGYVPITVCGRDERLRRRLMRLGVGIVVGWTDEMARLMAAADVLVENAGGLTSMEAFVAGLPVVSYRPIAGHGRHNAREMDRAGVARWARDRDQLRDLLHRVGTAGAERAKLVAQAATLFQGTMVVRLLEAAALGRLPAAAATGPRRLHLNTRARPAPGECSASAEGHRGAPLRGAHGPRRGIGAALVMLVVAALAAGGLAWADQSRGGQGHRLATGVEGVGSPLTQTPSPAAGGQFGVQASWIIDENSKPGTTAWQITPSVGTAPIEGYADHTSAQAGQTVKLYVSTAAPSFHVAAFRMGHYGGAGGRLVWASPALSGNEQDACALQSATKTVECSWTPSVSVDVDSSWLPGTYLFKLTADGGQQSYIPITIWDPSSHATYVIQDSVLTWQAWNDYGGYSNFGGLSRPGKHPSYAGRAKVLSFDRPYAEGSGASDFLSLELPLVSFAEQHGLDVTYWTDIDFSENPQLITNHKALLSLGHNEFITGAERQAEVSGLGKGVNLAFFGATPDLRPARLQPSPLGADREEVAYRDPRQDPFSKTDPKAATANTWAQRPLNEPASQIVGDTYAGSGTSAPLVVTDPGAWPFSGMGLRAGTQVHDVVLGAYDSYRPGKDSPANVEILAHSPVRSTHGHRAMADTTYYSDPAGGAGVFASGSIGWIPSLVACPPSVATFECPAVPVATITGNVLRLFGAGPAGVAHPSVANWRLYHT
jgi:UDP-N-acetylglucosamine:LPS N-acetylglucosamine transferase